MISLWEHQKKAVTDIREAIRTGHRHVMLMIPTGGGKTRTAAAIIESAIEKGKKVLFIADLRTLVDQSAAEFAKLGLDPSVMMADDPRYAPWKNLHICSAQTLMRRKEPDADLVIVDEAHVQYEYLTELMERWNKVVFIGLSATPFTRGLGKHYTSLVRGPVVAQLIKDGKLKEPICYGPDTISTKGLKMRGNDYDQKQLYDRVNKPEITADIINTYIELGDSRKFILFPVNVAHSKQLVNGFNEAGIPCQHIDAHTESVDRELYYEQLNTGELQGLSSVGVLSKGFDEPSVNCVILGFSTKSLIKYIQCAGRGLRAHEGQDDCIILDHGGNVERLGFPDDELPAFLCNGEKTEAARQKERDEEKKERSQEPKKCPACKKIASPDVFVCAGCGHIFSKRATVEVQDGELKKLDKVSPTEKARWLGMLLGYARSKGYADGWSAHKFKEKFGHFPAKKVGIHATAPDKEVMGFITHLNIKNAYHKKKASPLTELKDMVTEK